MKDVHLNSTENTTFREAHSLISKLKLAVILYQFYEFLRNFRLVRNMKDVHSHSAENTTFREAHSQICTVKVAVVLVSIIIQNFLLTFRIVGNL
jgi:hypothetical protein